MERSVSVYRKKNNGIYVLNPIGTFKGYGGYIGIGPYIELPTELAPEKLGEVVVDLLQKSGPTGVKISEFDEFSKNEDTKTKEIQTKYFPKKSTTTANLARNFLIAEVTFKDHQKSWKVLSRVYDSKLRCNVIGESDRVKMNEGIQGLGIALQKLLRINT